MRAIRQLANSREINRKIYFQCKDWIDNSDKHFLVLIGPRKCGKTVCFMQLKKLYNAQYFSFKDCVGNEAQDYIEDIIWNKTDGIFLLDEITYLTGYMNYLSSILSSVNENIVNGIEDTRKFLITGSQSYAIQNAARLALSCCTDYVRTSFIDFEEWLLWRHKIKHYGDEYTPSSDDFKDYMFNSSSFVKIHDNLEYIKDCLNEAIISEENSYKSIYGLIPGSAVNADVTLLLLHSCLARLHNSMSAQMVNKIVTGYTSIRTGNKDISKEIKNSTLEERLEGALVKLGIKLIKYNIKDLYNSVIFLQQLDLITITLKYDGSEIFYDKLPMFETKEEFFNQINICVKHPMFYFNMVREVLYDVDDLENKISNNIIGSALECYIKGLFSYKMKTDILHSYSYDYGEIDLLDFDDICAYEITASSKHTVEHLKVLSNEWNKVLVSSNDCDVYNGIQNKYYPKFLLDLIRYYPVTDNYKLRW